MTLEINDKLLYKMIKEQVNLILQKDLRQMIKQSINSVIKGIVRQEYEKIVKEQLTKKVSISLQNINFQKLLTDILRRDINSKMNTLHGVYSNTDQFNEYVGKILKQILKEKLNK